MFHARGIKGDKDLQAFRVDWDRNTIDVHTAGRTYSTPFNSAVAVAYLMRDKMQNARLFLTDPASIDELPRLYLKAFEEYLTTRMEKDGTPKLSPATLEL